MTDAQDRPPSIEENLAFLRAVAESGRRVTGAAGEHLVLWGVLTAFAYLNDYAVAMNGYESAWRIPAGYVAMIAAGWAGSVFFAARASGAGPAPLAARVYAIVFSSAGVALSFFAAGVGATGALPYGAIIVVAAHLMGVCFLVTGLLSKQRWIAAVGAGWLASGFGYLAIVDERALILVAAVGWIILMAVPGAVLLVARRKSTAASGVSAADIP
ncbi:MAG: hypothetical protein AAGJ87_13795 [Pseudomonadota bacterium]